MPSITSRKLPLVAAAASLVYHLLLAVLANYVPRDQYGASIAFWAYSWTSCVFCYFGVISVLARRSTSTTIFSYILFFDAAFSALWRFALLQYVARNASRDRCVRLGIRSGIFQDRSILKDWCKRTGVEVQVVHIVVAATLSGIFLMEVWLANVVRRYGEVVRREAVQKGAPEFSDEKMVVEVLVDEKK